MIDHPQPCYCQQCWAVQEMQRQQAGQHYGHYRPVQPPPPARPPRPRRTASGSLLGIGSVLAAVSLFGVWKLADVAAECGSALVTALAPSCGNYTTLHELAVVGLVIGAVMFVIGLVLSFTGN